MSRAPSAPRRCASCGWQWFRLRNDDEPDGMGVVGVNADAVIDAYAGVFECARCGAMLDGAAPPVDNAEPLRLVK